MPRDSDKELVHALLRWFRASARDLPWRARPLSAPRDPYRVLVSEIMLQQTQASRVAERFELFLQRFPDIEALAGAREEDVLAAWSGLGYYRRARLLHASARAIAREHGGKFPDRAEALAALPGVGRYTAGAIASLAFRERTAAVDANVTRVILRLEGLLLSASDAAGTRRAWSRASALQEAAPRGRGTAGLLNEAMIELGATVCIPRAPRCESCPIAAHCAGRRRGVAHTIPLSKPAPRRKPLFFASVLVADGAGRLAVTRRPTGSAGGGLWAGLHEAPTMERPDRPSTPAEVRRWLGLASARGVRRVASFPFQTTHRDCTFDVYAARPPRDSPAHWSYLAPEAIAGLGLSTPQRRILLELGPRSGAAPGGPP